MADADDNFVFGQPDQTERGKKRGFPFFTLLSLIVLAALVRPAIKGWNEFYARFGEKAPPIIEIQGPLPGIGLEPTELKIVVKDEGSGLDEVIVRSEQGDQVKNLVKKRYNQMQNEDLITVPFKGKSSGFDEGKLRIAVLVFDRSYWSNSARATVDLDVSYEKPTIEIVSAQHNAVHGGAELAFYSVKSREEVFSGITSASDLFPGFRAKKLDSAFEGMNNLYFSFFAIPLSFKDDQDLVQLLIRDRIGNTNTSSMYYRVSGLARPAHDVEVSKDLLEIAAGDQFDRLEAMRNRQRPGVSKEGRGDPLDRFRAVNDELRRKTEDDLKAIFSHPKSQRFWREAFLRPTGRPFPYPFGSIKRYWFEGESLGSSEQKGVDYQLPEGSPVRAANDGIVIAAAEIGIYGNIVVLDHGFGLTSMYTNLSSIEHLEGTRVVTGQVIGHSGRSGLVDEPTLGFQMRLHGIPVRPIEWWDKKWIADHIESKIDEMKRKFGLAMQQPL